MREDLRPENALYFDIGVVFASEEEDGEDYSYYAGYAGSVFSHSVNFGGVTRGRDLQSTSKKDQRYPHLPPNRHLQFPD